MKILRDVVSFVFGSIGMALFMIGGGLIMLAVLVNDDVPVRADFNSMKAPISPVEKKARN